MKNILLIFVLLILISVSHAGNFTINNTTQFQAALNTAASNSQHDTINVQSGTYNVNPTLTFSSNENYFLFIRGTGSPVLEGTNLRQLLQLSSLASNGDIRLEGITFQHGRANYGGALNILTQNADVFMNNCTFNDNTAGFVCGGANIFSNTGNITVTNCTFRRNFSPNTSGYPYGTAGGLFIQTDGTGTVITLRSSTFEQNSAHRDAAGAMLYPLGSNSTVIAESNSFINNTAREFGGGCWIRCPGGNSTVIYRNNTLTGNSSSTAGSGGGTYIQIASGKIDLYDNIHNSNNASWQGGGLWIEHGGGTLNILRNKFNNNTSGESGGGANLFLDNGTLRFSHNVFSRNRTSGPGGGINLSTNTGRLNVFNNSFYLNSASDGGSVNLYFDNSAALSNFYNNILYNSSIPALSYSGQQSVTARYSDIQGGTGQPWFGTGCIDRYPFFADTAGGNFHLQDSIHCGHLRYSSCIDAGDPAVHDYVMNCGWGLGTNRSDMGAYGGRDSAAIGIKIINSEAPRQFSLSQNYPNPFNPVTKIKFDIPPLSFGEGKSTYGAGVRLIVYDILGREITTLVNERLSPGSYEVEWDASNYPSGVYFYKLVASDFSETKKMVLFK